MDLMQSSEEWSKAHLSANDLLSQLLNQLRDLGYNPGYHISYDKSEQHLVIEDAVLAKHREIQPLYDSYIHACKLRDEAVEKIQQAPKVDLGF